LYFLIPFVIIIFKWFCVHITIMVSIVKYAACVLLWNHIWLVKILLDIFKDLLRSFSLFERGFIGYCLRTRKHVFVIWLTHTIRWSLFKWRIINFTMINIFFNWTFLIFLIFNFFLFLHNIKSTYTMTIRSLNLLTPLLFWISQRLFSYWLLLFLQYLHLQLKHARLIFNLIH
jgi:hypothetical protein